MSFPRKPIKIKTSQDVELLCLDWIECDETIYQDKQFSDNSKTRVSICYYEWNIHSRGIISHHTSGII